jgi:hypothetical protein
MISLDSLSPDILSPNTLSDCEAARRVAAVCRLPEAEIVQECLQDAETHPAYIDLLWLTWVQWRALGREAMMRETGLSPWTITQRLRQLREAGAPVLSWTEEREMLARGRFAGEWG